MGKTNENISYAKSILSKNGIKNDSPEYQDYLKIRKICGNNNGYVGILTKLYFIDRVNDMDEIESIFNILKNSKIDINKLNKLTYEKILDIFYDEFEDKKDLTDYELIFKDDEYSYYRVYTYKGILEIGSPAWCLKTKSMWDKYQAQYPEQWVVICNKYKGRLLTPDSNYLKEYINKGKSWVRYGISVNGGKWTGFDDNDDEMKYTIKSWTSYGVLSTLTNIRNGIKKSWYENFTGCKKLPGDKVRWHKVVNEGEFLKKIEDSTSAIKGNENYVLISNSYSFPPLVISLSNSDIPFTYVPTSSNNFDTFVNLKGEIPRKIIEDFAKVNRSLIYGALLLKLGEIKEEKLLNHTKFIKKINEWYIFDWNEEYFIIINSDLDKGYQLPLYTKSGSFWNMDKPMYWLLDKKKLEPHNVEGEFTKEIIEYLKGEKNDKVKGFMDFFK